MKLDKILLLAFILFIGFVSCKKDDDSDDDFEIEENDRTEQQIIDNDSLIGYLETHYYNASDFQEIINPSALDVVFTELIDGETLPDGSTLLIDAVETKTTTFEDADYEYYILRLNQGLGDSSPSFADSVYAEYEGSTLDNEVFETVSNINSGSVDLLTLIRGWQLVFPEFNVASDFIENIDGTVDYNNHGAGVMFLPSGLGFFSTFINSSQYAPVIFKFNLIGIQENDHDGDGIPSYLEDLNGDGEFTVNFDDLEDTTDDDTDGDGFANYIDTDDDDDGVLTIYEDLNEDGNFNNDDTDGDGIPNYLDADDTESTEDVDE